MASVLRTHPVRRKTFLLRLWTRGRKQPEWIGEVQDVSTGETTHVIGLEALFHFLEEKTTQALVSPGEPASTERSEQS